MQITINGRPVTGLDINITDSGVNMAFGFGLWLGGGQTGGGGDPVSPVAFDPAQLFGPNDAGPIYNFADTDTLFIGDGVTPVSADGDVVQVITDARGGANRLVQATSGARAAYKTDGDWPGLRFDGVNDFYVSDENFGVAGDAPSSAFMVYRIYGDGSASGDRYLFSIAETGAAVSANEVREVYRQPSTEFGPQSRAEVGGTDSGADTTYADGASTTLTRFVYADFGGGTYQITGDGSDPQDPKTPLAPPDYALSSVDGPIHIGRRGLSNASWMMGDIHWGMFLTRKLATYERQALEGWAAWEFGGAAQLPAGHPYKSAAPSVVAPAPVDGVVATPGIGSIALAWGVPASGAAITGYLIERSADDGATWATLATSAGTSHDDATAVPWVAYVYRVSATSAAGTGDASAVAYSTLIVAEALPSAPPHSARNWYDMTAPASMTLGSGNVIDIVADQIGGGDLTGEAGFQPVYLPAEYGVRGYTSRGAARFREADQTYLSMPGAMSIDNRAHTILIIARDIYVTSGQKAQALVHGKAASGNAVLGEIFTNTGEDVMIHGTAGAGTPTLGTGLSHPSSTTSYVSRGGASAGAVGQAGRMTTGGPFTAGSPTNIRVGTWNNVQYWLQGLVAAVVVYDKALSDSELDDLFDWAESAYGARSRTEDDVLVFSGDSITWGAVSDNPQENPFSGNYSYPAQIANKSSMITQANLGKPGALLENNTGATDVAAALGFASTRTNRVVFGLWGHNDVALNRTAAATKSALDTWIASIRAADAGAVIGHGTLLPTDRGGWDQAVADEFNAYVMDDSPSGPDLDFRIDTNATPGMENPSDDSLYYETPGIGHVHPMPLGYGRLADFVHSEMVRLGVIAAGT